VWGDSVEKVAEWNAADNPRINEIHLAVAIAMLPGNLINISSIHCRLSFSTISGIIPEPQRVELVDPGVIARLSAVVADAGEAAPGYW